MATFDIAILGDPELDLSLLDFDNRMATGIYKLVQRVLILLFTDSEAPASAGRGTDLPREVFGANVTDIEIIRNQFNIAAQKVTETLITETDLDAPDDEKLASLRVEVIAGEAPDAVDTEVTVLTVAGEEFTVVVPTSNTSALLEEGTDGDS